MEYTHLSEQEAVTLRHERIRTLEAQHFRVGLALEEDPESPNARQDLADLESRIRFQRAMVGMDVPPDPGVPGGPDTPGSDDAAGQLPPVGDPVAMSTDTNTNADEPRPEGLETKAVDPEYQASGTEDTTGQTEDDAQGDTATEETGQTEGDGDGDGRTNGEKLTTTV